MDTQLQTLILLLAGVVLVQSSPPIDRETALRSTMKARNLPGLDVCGQTLRRIRPAVVGGQPAKLGDYPWMANIGYGRDESMVKWLCGGSLVTDRYVVTAGHCLHPNTIAPLRVIAVRLGELDLDPRVKDGATPKDFRAEKITYHEQYNTKMKINDIGLIKLQRKVTFTQLIRPICLPTQRFDAELFVGFSPTVAGWGATMFGRAPTNTILLEAEVTIQDTEKCKENMTNYDRNLVIDERVICAASQGKDACQGDSGGPLMLDMKINRSNNIYLMGIVSYGHNCALEGYPGVYTRVVKYVEWIVNHLDV